MTIPWQPGNGGNMLVPPGYTDPHTWSPNPSQPMLSYSTIGEGQSLIVWNLDPAGVFASSVSTAGTVYAMRIPLTGGAFTFSNISMAIGIAGSGLTSGQNFAAVYDDQGNRVGVSADQTTAWASAGIATMPLTGAPFTGTWRFLYCACVANGTTPPQFMRAGNTPLFNLGTSGSFMRAAVNGTGQTSLPASLTYSSNSATGALGLWAALS